MSTNGVGGYNYRNYMSKQEAADAKAAAEAKGKAKTEKAGGEEADVAEEAVAATETATETKVPQKAETYKPDMDKIREMKADLKNNMLAFKQMVFAQVKDQGKMADKAGGTDLSKLLDLSNISQEDAQANIAEGGYWGVDATANRILDFAKALAGGDPSKISMLKDAVQKGFDAAGKVWGGTLPGISYQTLDKVMKGFDDWENESKAATTTAAAEK